MNEPLMEIGEVLTDCLKVHMKTPPCHFCYIFISWLLDRFLKQSLKAFLHTTWQKLFFSAEQREELDCVSLVGFNICDLAPIYRSFYLAPPDLPQHLFTPLSYTVLSCVVAVGSRYVEEANDRATSGCPDPDVAEWNQKVCLSCKMSKWVQPRSLFF